MGYIYFDDPAAGLVIFLCLYGVYPAYKSNEERKLKQLMMKFGDRFEMHEMGEPLTDLYVRDKQ